MTCHDADEASIRVTPSLVGSLRDWILFADPWPLTALAIVTFVSLLLAASAV